MAPWNRNLFRNHVPEWTSEVDLFLRTLSTIFMRFLFHPVPAAIATVVMKILNATTPITTYAKVKHEAQRPRNPEEAQWQAWRGFLIQL